MQARLLSTSQAALQLGCSQQKVLKLIHSGKLEAVDTSAGTHPRYGINREALDRVMSLGTQPRHPTIQTKGQGNNEQQIH